MESIAALTDSATAATHAGGKNNGVISTYAHQHLDGSGAAATSNLVTTEKLRPSQVTGFKRHIHTLRETVWELAELQENSRLMGCGRFLAPGAAAVEGRYKGRNGGAYLAGYQRCHSVHACPVCSAGITKARMDELAAGVSAFLAEGAERSVVAVTFTIRHKSVHALKDLFSLFTSAWKKLQASRAFKELKRAHSIVGTVWGEEATHGRNGWHPHRHLIFLLERGELSEVERVALEKKLAALWINAVVGVGGCAPTRERAVKVDATGSGRDAGMFAKYAVKGQFKGLADETAGGAFKEAAEGHRTPFQVLQDISAAGGVDAADAHNVALWNEWVEASHGRPQLRYSRGLKARLSIAVMNDAVALATGEAATVQDEAAARGEVVEVQPERSIFRVVDGRSRARLAADMNLRFGVQSIMDSADSWEYAQVRVVAFLESAGLVVEPVNVLVERVTPPPMDGEQMDSVRWRARLEREARAVLSAAARRRVPLYPAPRVSNAGQWSLLEG